MSKNNIMTGNINDKLRKQKVGNSVKANNEMNWKAFASKISRKYYLIQTSRLVINKGLLTECEVCTTSTSSNVNNTIDPERPLSSNLVASNPASGSAKIRAKANLTKWKVEQSSVLVHECKERIEEVERSRATETWRHIFNAENKVGTHIKQCKPIRKLKATITRRGASSDSAKTSEAALTGFVA